MGIADDMKRITEDIVASYDMRVKALGDLVVDTRKTLKGFASDRKKMASEQAKSLADFAKEIETYIKKRLEEFSNAHAEMSEALKKSLAKYVGDIVSGVKKLLGDYSSDMKKAKEAWRSMASALAKSRKEGVVPRIEAGEKVTTVEEAVAKKAKKKKRGRK